jgi:hypothetical protein
VVCTRITTEGLQVLKELDSPVLKLHREQFGHLSAKRLRVLVALLEAARNAAD